MAFCVIFMPSGNCWIIPKVPALEARKFDQIIENCPILKGDFSLEFVSIKQV